MTQKYINNKKYKTQAMIQRVKNKCVKETVKIAECAAINARKEKKIVKK